MDKDINTLSGIEFEILCQQLLQKMGFEVETTKASGDGGIDLIAINHQALLSGKYIVQCKRYVGSVGEPIIRDLYGVVMSERANKGILITTGHFTFSAIEFAQDKNIELIDGVKLHKLLNQYEEVNLANEVKIFFEHDGFDRSKYFFYKDVVVQTDCTEEMAFDYLKFLFSYMVNSVEPDFNAKDFDNYDLQNSDISDLDLIHSGLAREFERYFKWYIDKYYKKGKVQLLKRPFLVYKYAGIASLYNFDLFNYVHQRYSLLKGDIGLYIAYDGRPYYRGDYRMYYEIKQDIDKMLQNPDAVKFIKKYYFYELMNLYSLFQYFDIELGKKKILEIATRSFLEEDYHVDESKLLELYSKERTFDMMLNEKRFIILHPAISESYDFNGKDKRVFKDVITRYRYAVNYTSYYEKYASESEEKIQTEISKIEVLLNTLQGGM